MWEQQAAGWLQAAGVSERGCGDGPAARLSRRERHSPNICTVMALPPVHSVAPLLHTQVHVLQR
jgi:hypothetical protein